MSVHAAIATLAPRTPLELIQLPTEAPEDDEVLVKVLWVSTGPADLHQTDKQAFDSYPFVIGDSITGEVVQVGSKVHDLQAGDKVFGFLWRSNRQRGMQEFVTAPRYQLGRLPSNISPQEASVVPVNFVTVFNAFARNVPGGRLPWPKPENWLPDLPDRPLLIWGGSSSVGQYAIQILKFYGYRNIITTASKQHHPMLQQYGAAQYIDYRASDVEEQLRSALKSDDPPLIFDCIGSASASLGPISRTVPPNGTVVFLLPIVVRDATEKEEPQYAWDAKEVAQWPSGINPDGVRTYFYLEDEQLAQQLQSDIMPSLLASGAVKPNKFREVEGATLLERAQKALDMIRRKELSAERLTLRVQ